MKPHPRPNPQLESQLVKDKSMVCKKNSTVEHLTKDTPEMRTHLRLQGKSPNGKWQL